jgi:DnaK suppressor protein
MNAQQIAEAKLNLISRKENLEERLAKIEASKKRKAPLSQDFEEQAIELENNEVIDALDEMELSELKQINAALMSLDDGTYGLCAECGTGIGEGRIHALPFTRLCIDCANTNNAAVNN